MEALREKLTQQFRDTHMGIKIIYPRYCMILLHRCTYAGVDCDEPVEQTRSLMYSASGPSGIFMHQEKYTPFIKYSQVYELIENLALPCTWAEDVDLGDGYLLKQMRLSKNQWPGEIVCRAVRNNWFKNLRWNDLPTETKDRIRQAVADKMWPVGYPQELKEFFSDVTEIE